MSIRSNGAIAEAVDASRQGGDAPIHASPWIWCNNQPQANNQHAFFRRTLSLDKPPRAARFHIGADMRYWLYVNGQCLGYGPARSHEPEPFYDTYELSDVLKQGVNVVAVHVYGLGEVRRCSSFMTVRCALVAALDIDGEVVRTDSDWKAYHETAYAQDTPRHSNHQAFVECYDARRGLQGWQQNDFDDRAWPVATILGQTGALAPWQRLMPRPIPMLTLQPRLPAQVIESGRMAWPASLNFEDMATHAEIIEQASYLPDDAAVEQLPRQEAEASQGVPPIAIRSSGEHESAYAVFDFAQNDLGFVQITLRGVPGTIVDLGYSEAIETGRPETYKQRIRYADRVILGDEVVTYRPVLAKTLRYLHIAVHGDAVIDALQHQVTRYPVQWRGTFHSNDEVLDAVAHAGARTLQACMVDTFVDTPRREFATWLMDLRIEALGAYQWFGDAQLARHTLGMGLQSQDRPGRYIDYGRERPGWIVARYPSIDGDRMPETNTTIASQVYEHFLHCGDRSFVESAWPRLKQLHKHLESFRTADDLLITDGSMPAYGYLLIDWAPLDRQGQNTAFNVMHCAHLRTMATLARIMKDDATAHECEQLHARTRRAVSQHLWDDDRGMFVNGRSGGKLTRRVGYHENLLAILHEVATAKQQASIIDRLLPTGVSLPQWKNSVELFDRLQKGGAVSWDDQKLVPLGSPYFTFFALWALFEIGHDDTALATLRSLYGGVIAEGGTTIYEKWDGTNGSRSHGWGVGATVLLQQYVAGVQPIEPGYDTFAVMPSPGDLREVRSRVATPKGTTQVHWRRDDGRMCIEVAVPPGTHAHVGVPTMANEPPRTLNVDGQAVKPELITLRRGRYAAAWVGPGVHRVDTCQTQ